MSCLVVSHYHVGICSCTLQHDNLFQGGTSADILKEVIGTFSSEGDCILDITGKSGEDACRPVTVLKPYPMCHCMYNIHNTCMYIRM